MPPARVLIASPSKVHSTILEKQLSSLFAVTVVEDTAEAVGQLNSDMGFMALILDINIKPGDGFNVLQSSLGLKPDLKIIVTTDKQRQDVEARAIESGADYLLTTPLDFDLLFALLKIWNAAYTSKIDSRPVKDSSGKTFPFSTLKKCCYICGYEEVKMHVPIEEGYEESWEYGLYPVFKSREGFEPWDFLRSTVAVCPYCFFASSQTEDFADVSGQTFPFKPDAKKILSRTISTRKRFVSGPLEIDRRFDDPYRDLEKVLASLKLAEKCMNGLILGEKVGTHCQLGYYQMLLSSLDRENRTAYYHSALESFNNQLKETRTSSVHIAMAHYFCIVLQMTFGKSEVAKGIVDLVVKDFQERGNREVSAAERVWLARISHIWNSGLISEKTRELM